MQRGEVRCVHVALRVPLRNPVIRICSVYCDGNRSWVRSTREYTHDRCAVGITCRWVMAIAAGEVLVYGQLGVEDLKLAQSLDLMVWIQVPWLRPRPRLGFEHGFFRPDPLGIRIIRDDALQVKSLARQYAF